ncbi:MAG: ABC transporter substrate-binding protein, partial [Burkholderiales bacterium PBB5]
QPFWTQTLPALTHGQLQAEIVPFDRAGIRGQSMLRLMQLGVVPFGTVLLALSNVDDPMLGAPDLPGLFADLPALRRALALFRPMLQQRLRERHGIELLAVYAYPAQMLFCRRALSGLDDLAGRRVRVSGVTQADLMTALGAQPVFIEFADLLPQVTAGTVDCAITGSMSGNTIGLHAISSHLYALPISWGLQVFAANAAAWAALPAPLQLLLRQHLPQLEQAIWNEAERETGDGVACNTGAASCQGGQRGRMVLVPATPADRQRLHQLVQQQVLPRWAKRCGQDCVPLWNSTLGQATGLPASSR